MTLYKFLCFLRLPEIFRFLTQRNKLTILIYHNPKVDVFKKHLSYLEKKYTLLSMNQALIKLNNEQLPRYPMVITFDDGHADNYKLLPLFKHFKVRPTIFLVSDIVTTKKPFWFNHKDIIAPKSINLKKVNNDTRLAYIKNSEFNTFCPKAREALSLDEILEMKPLVDFQSHTCSHPILPKCSNEDSLREISSSKTTLENLLHQEINGFAYPNGDYSKREIDILKQSGYSYALTIDQGLNTKSTSRFLLKRIGTNDTHSIDEFIIRSSGFWAWLRRFTKR